MIKYCSAGNWPSNIRYLHPLPDSRFVTPATTIIARFNNDSLLINNNDVEFSVSGLLSGTHQGQTIISRESRTFIFKPSFQFKPEEKVTVSIHVPKQKFEFSFSFTISPTSGAQFSLDQTESNTLTEYNVQYNNENQIVNGVSVPRDFPIFKPSIQKQPLEGLLFVTTEKYLMILWPDGTPYFYYKYDNRRVWDFTVQPHGMLSYMVGATAYLLDNHFEKVDSISCGHGYYTDPHEFLFLPNGHSLLIAWDSQIIDMSQIVAGGKKNAEVIGTHIIELDRDKNIIFEWRCWDHYRIQDALHENLTATTIHYVHMNAIEVDYDDQLVVSVRHQDEITKIDRDTGDIIWRLGGPHNQFEFVNDPDRFTYQHDIGLVPGKPDHYTMMDNGNYHNPPYSRAVEYELDTVNMTATKVWEYRHSPDRYTHWMGSVNRLPSGNTIIGWSYQSLPKITEVTPDGDIIYEGNYSQNWTCYRAHRLVWSGHAIRPFLSLDAYTDKITLVFNQFNDPGVKKYYIYGDIHNNPVSRIDSTSNTFINLTQLMNFQTYYFRVTSVDSNGMESRFSNQIKVDTHFYQPGNNLILNGDFSQNLQHWTISDNDSLADWEINSQGQFHIQVLPNQGQYPNIQLIQSNLVLMEGRTYRLEFDANTAKDEIIEVKLTSANGFIDYSEIGMIQLTESQKRYSFDFFMDYSTDLESNFVVDFSYVDGELDLDNISVSELTSSVLEDILVEKPEEYGLRSSYPNPFNMSTTIQYKLPYDSRVKLSFYDILGKIIKTVKFKKQIRGQYQYVFEGDNLNSGLYFCKLEALRFSNHQRITDTIKLMCIK